MSLHDVLHASIAAAATVSLAHWIWRSGHASGVAAGRKAAAADAAAADALRIAARKDVDSLVGTPVPKP